MDPAVQENPCADVLVVSDIKDRYTGLDLSLLRELCVARKLEALDYPDDPELLRHRLREFDRRAKWATGAGVALQRAMEVDDCAGIVNRPAQRVRLREDDGKKETSLPQPPVGTRNITEKSDGYPGILLQSEEGSLKRQRRWIS